MALYVLGSEKIEELPATTFAAEKIQERGDLQRLLREQIEILVPGGLVLAEEFRQWDDSIRRIDLLVIDKFANLIVVELKRTEDGGHMELQALRYAAMVSSMTWEQAVEAHRHYLGSIGKSDDPEVRLLNFLEQAEPDKDRFNQDVRIVLASADFSKEVTTTVLWLNERDLDIRCVRMVPYKNGSQTLLDVQQVIPLPEAEEYQVRVREKASQERTARKRNPDLALRRQAFWDGLAQKLKTVPSLSQHSWRYNNDRYETQTRGIFLIFIVGGSGIRLQLYLGPNNESNSKRRAIYDELAAHRSEIQGRCQAPLQWNGDDLANSINIVQPIDVGAFDDESNWDALQIAMIDAMVRFDAAFAPYLDRYRRGEKPNVAGLQ